jgi:selenide,water dikinase
VVELAELGVVTGGDRRNREYVGDALEVEGVGGALVAVAFDPQTAGGLLVALPPERASAFEAASPAARRIGSVAAGSGVLLAG